jgi:predicted HicB family RNase H-like nuclease
MARPKPIELLVKFFPELTDKTLASSNKEASKELNVRICEAIISDLINKYDSLHSYMGDGALIVKLASLHGKPTVQTQNFINKFSLEQDLEEAKKNGDSTVEEFLKDILQKVSKMNLAEEICILLIDNSGGSAAILPRENPAKRIQAMMNDL